MQEKKFALLIDSDNVSAKYIKSILDEMTKYGTITYRRIYGDWTNTLNAKWKQELLEYSITPIQQYSYTSGKNATDSSLIIDAMDILYTNQVDGFCIVSSDSDFTKLASRLRESGMEVIGMGESKTPRPFRAACSIFTLLENLVDNEDNEEETAEQLTGREETASPTDNKKEEKHTKNSNASKSNVTHKDIIEKDIVNIMIENINNGRETHMGEVGRRLVNKYPDFDVRNYGYSLLSKFIEDMAAFEVVRENHTCMIQPKDKNITNDKIIMYLQNAVRNHQQISLNRLANLVNNQYQNFNVKDYGYSKFSKLIENIPNLELTEIIENKKKVKAVKWQEG